ncbi:MAG: VanZ family protein [Bacteroidaceae bacterium]|nr:VanZ family protein [Bacteroidaceae bacterium]
MELVKEIYEDIKIGFEHYLPLLKSDVPDYIWEMLFSILCVGFVAILICKGVKSGQYVSRLLLVEYSFLLYCTTIFFRAAKDHYEYNYRLFWSYEQYRYEVQSVMNVLVFIPVGMLIGLSFRKLAWWKALLGGCLLSVSIELLQLISRRGFSELDDVMHNTIGCVIGYALVMIPLSIVRIMKRIINSY